MNNIMIPLEEYEGYFSDSIGYKEITGHFVFGIKIGENVCGKSRYFADGHKTGPSYSLI